MDILGAHATSYLIIDKRFRKNVLQAVNEKGFANAQEPVIETLDNSCKNVAILATITGSCCNEDKILADA